MLQPLPIDDFIDEVRGALDVRRAAVLTAEPGAGKTTRVPPALAADHRVIVLQPRRIAARSLASHIAAERGWAIGREVGWQIRFERRFSSDTRLLFATEGILTARLQNDPLLSDFDTIVFDEFHERSLHADVAIALAKQAWLARSDLRILVMSATLDSGRVAAFLDDCPQIAVPGRLHPVDVSYAPALRPADAAEWALSRTSGDILCFLPGAFEIDRTIAEMKARVWPSLDILRLHGSLAPADQDRVFTPTSGRRVVVATNIAETSVTVPRVTAVVDSGLQKTARYDADRGIDSLEVERIAADSAEQRSGRAGRIAPGIAVRLWDPRDRLRSHREPEIFRVDLAGALLDVVAWGGDPRQLEWMDPPPADALNAGLSLLERLGLVRESRLTAFADRVRRLPLHPRLARVLVEAEGSADAARACALLSERHLMPPRSAATTSDVLSALDLWASMPPHVRRVADEIARSYRALDAAAKDRSTENGLRRALFAGFPDRVGRRRAPGSPRVLMASGAGAVVVPQSGVVEGEFLTALDLHASRRDDPDARIRIASIVDREWLIPTQIETVHVFDEARGVVRAIERDRYDALVLAERAVPVDPEIAVAMLSDAWHNRGPDEDDRRLLHRAAFAGCVLDVPVIVRAAASGARSLDEVRLRSALPASIRAKIDRDAPETLRVPSGRTIRLEYGADGGVSAAVKLQDLFGVLETPRVGPNREPVLIALLAPNGRPVQLTRDLKSFWERTYPEVRKELRGRYPKHKWPEVPTTARRER